MKLGAVEARFAALIWDHEPIGSGALVKLCEQTLHWKKPTTYTVLRKLCERGIFQNKDGVVTSVLSRQEFQAIQSEQFVAEAFAGSLPSFIAAFTKRNALTPEEADQIRKMIEEF